MVDKLDVAVPTVHLNGTSKDRLLEVNREALQAVRDAIEKLGAAAPHARDFYVQAGEGEADPYMRAAKEHTERQASLSRVRDELEAVLNGVRRQR